jgi:hypothetical protein
MSFMSNDKRLLPEMGAAVRNADFAGEQPRCKGAKYGKRNGVHDVAAQSKVRSIRKVMKHDSARR